MREGAVPVVSGSAARHARLHPWRLVACAGLLALVCTAPAAAQLVREPYLQVVTPHSATVVWRTGAGSPGDSRVRYGTTLGALDRSALGGATIPGSNLAAQDHSVTVTGLSPATRYFYDVGTASGGVAGGGTAEHYFFTAPPVGSRTPAVVWVLGDSGEVTEQQTRVREALLDTLDGQHLDLFLHVGDLAYDNGSDAEFTAKFFASYADVLRHTVFWPAVGNHEVGASDSPSQSGPYFEAFVLPAQGEAGGVASGTEAYYSFDHANAHFVVLDTADSELAPGSAQLAWLQSDLAATTQEWLIAYWHHPAYTRGTHDSNSSNDSGGRHVAVRENVLPILEAAGVDLVVAGHSHIYERSYLLDQAYGFGSAPNFATPDFATLLSAGRVLDSGDGDPDGDGAYVKTLGLNANDGALYVTAGHGAEATHGPANHPVMFFSEKRNGSVLLEIDAQRLSLRNVRSDGVVSDRFVLEKNGGTILNRAPLAADDLAIVGAGESLEVHVLENDVDVDGELDPASVTLTRLPEAGSASVRADGVVLYAHAGASGAGDSFAYTVADDRGAVSNVATVTVTPSGERVTQGLLVLYRFGEGAGTLVRDLSGAGDPLHLQLANEDAIEWLPGGGLRLASPTVLATSAAASKVIAAARTTRELTVEVWVRPENLEQTGPVRIVAVSQDSFPNGGNLVLGQEGTGYSARLRTSATSAFGRPSVDTASGAATTTLTHLVYTRRASGEAQIYQNGALVSAGDVAGDLSNWNDSYGLTLANEPDGDRPFLGDLHLVAIYARALGANEVLENFAAGLSSDEGAPPIANFTAAPASGEAPLDVVFDAAASIDPDGSIVTYEWSFGDGASGDGVSASHRFETSGTYTVTLTVTDGEGASDQASRTVTVRRANQPPVARYAASPKSGPAPLLVTLSAASSADPDGRIVSYVWDFGDGAIGSGLLTTHRFEAPGTYAVRLVVIDDAGAEASTEDDIVVTAANRVPVALFSASPKRGTAPLAVALDASPSSDPDGDALTFAWDLGEGAGAHGGQVEHRYETPGTFSVELTVSDARGGSSVSRQTITVLPPNQPPVARFTVSPRSGEAPHLVILNASSSSDPERARLDYAWSFGDGGSATGPLVSHRFLAAGTYTIRLTVTDPEGASDSVSDVLRVEPPQTLTIVAQPVDTTVLEGRPATFRVDAVGGAPLVYRWQRERVDLPDATGPTYTVAPARRADDGVRFRCVVTASAGEEAVSEEVTLNVLRAGRRVTAGLVALYPFTEGAGRVVRDVAGGASPVDLEIVDPSAVRWLPGGGLEVHSPALLASSGPARGVLDPLRASHELTLEAWVRPDNLEQRGPARIVAVSRDATPNGGNLVLAQERGRYVVRLRTEETNQYGLPALETDAAAVATELTHVVYTRESGGATTLYLDGEVVERGRTDGLFATWGEDYSLCLADEPSRNRPFLGVYRLVAIYDRALEPSEVEAHFDAGPEGGANRPPEARFVFSGDDGPPPLTVAFDASGSSDPDGSVLDYHWAFGDGAEGSGPLATHRYEKAGAYVVTLTVADDEGATASAQATLELRAQRQAPTARFSANPKVGDAPLIVVFSAVTSRDADGRIVAYDWDYGDGSAGKGSFVGHKYERPGTYTARLRVTDNDGETAEATTRIEVAGGNVAPEARFSASPETGEAPLIVVFNADSSVDRDGRVVAYAWDFGDGTQGTGSFVGHKYEEPGSYTARLRVSDDDGATGEATRRIEVAAANAAPEARFSATPSSGRAPLAVVFSAVSSRDADGRVVAYEWDYGDGERGTGSFVSHTYREAGGYTARLVVTDNDGAAGEATRRIEVAGGNVAPEARFSASPETGAAPLIVVFNADSSVDRDGRVVAYAWDFGDGTQGTGSFVGHKYEEPGDFEVTLRVTDDDGASGSASRAIAVRSGAVRNEPPVARFTANPSRGPAPLVVVFSAQLSNDPDGEIASYRWEFGEGPAETGLLRSHRYESAGTYQATLTVTDDDGARASTTMTIVVTSLNALTITTQPQDRSVVSGERATFTVVTAGASAPLSYQWQREGRDIAGATARSYTTPPVTAADDGARFRVRIRAGTGGAVTSEAATLHVVAPGGRVHDGILALYRFSGDLTVRDTSGVGRAVDLEVADGRRVRAAPGGGLRVTEATRIVSAEPVTKVTDAIRQSQALTVEAWVRPANAEQAGPARILALSQDPTPNGGNFVLGQEGSSYTWRLRTSETNQYGAPGVSTRAGSLTPAWTHVVCTRNASGNARVYLNGREAASTQLGGQLSAWDRGHFLAAANEPVGDRPFLGDLRLLAVYGRALSPAEVLQNFESDEPVVAEPPAGDAPAGDAPDAGANLALGRPVKASSVEDITWTTVSPEFAVDGKLDTRWSSKYTDPSWLYVDLGAERRVSRAVLRWEAAFATSYQIQVSADAESWRTVFTTTRGDGGVDTVDFAPTTARYVRVRGSVRATQWGYSVWEFEVYAAR